MQYQKLTPTQKAIRKDRLRVYTLATKIQSEAAGRGEYIARNRAISMAWAMHRGKHTK